MRGSKATIAAWILALVIGLPSTSRSEESTAALNEEDAPPEEAPVTPSPIPEEQVPEPESRPPSPRTGPRPGDPFLRCAQVQCHCASPPEERDGNVILRLGPPDDCVMVDCYCVSVAPPAPMRTPEEETVSVVAEEPVEYEPPGVAGFLVSRRDVGLLLEVGFPFLEAELSFGLHDAVELGVGYRSFWGMSSMGYLSLRIRVYHSVVRRAAVSLMGRAGYTHVGSENHGSNTSWAGGDAAMGELLVAASIGRGRHFFFMNLGARFGWVRSHTDCDSDRDYGCYSTAFPDGSPGVLAAALFDVGWAARLRSRSSFFLAVGFFAYFNGEGVPGCMTARIGFLFDFPTARSEGGER